MSVLITQTCDGCGASRPLRTLQAHDDGGWRRIPVDGALGIARDEQPTLCPPCLRAVAAVIRAGIKHEVNSDGSPS